MKQSYYFKGVRRSYIRLVGLQLIDVLLLKSTNLV